MHKIKQKIMNSSLALVLFMSLFGVVLVPAPAFAAAPPCPYDKSDTTQALFTPWYRYLKGEVTNGQCHVKPYTTKDGKIDLVKNITLIAVAIIELLTRLSALIAVGFIIYGSIQYITSQGEPEGIGNAKTTIANAIVGLIIVILAIGIVQFVGRLIQK